MKRIIGVFLILIVLFSFCGCEKIEKNPYDTLLMKDGISFGMSTDEVGEVLGETPIKAPIIVLYPSVIYKGMYSIFKIEYTFYDEGEEEFVNTTELAYITYTINDLVKYEDRTAEKHGDMDSEYELIKEHLSGAYSAPFKESNDGTARNKKSAFWEIDNNIGITLTLKNETDMFERGTISLVYKDTQRLKKPWYEY